MNYIAHIHLAASTNTSLLGNFLGDFVKGKDLSFLPEELQHGIWLHRKIDVFTDSHAEIKALKRQFPGELQRMSGVCLDIWFDHLLLSRNADFLPLLLPDLLDDFYRELNAFEMDSPRYKAVRQSLLKGRWLVHYKDYNTCHQAFSSVERRLNNRIVFADKSFEYMVSNHKIFEQAFTCFYPELLAYALALVDADLTKPAH